MAQAFASLHGKDSVESYSAGSRPSGQINPKAIAAMNEISYDLTAHQSKSLDEIPDITYDAVITMGCGDECPWIQAHYREDWDIPDPRNMNEFEFRNVRNMIQEKVIHLLKTL